MMTKEGTNYNVRLIFGFLILLLFPIYIVKSLYFDESKVSNEEAEYVGKETCIECHETEYKSWKGSHHDKAMDLANDSTVLGDFNDAILIRNGQTHRMFTKDSAFYVITDGENGKMKEYKVEYVFGFTPLQNYLVSFPGGRLQTLALTWNSLDSNWFYMSDSVYSGQNISHQNWLHWSNQAQNWNSMCAYCHSTNLIKGYDIATDSYKTTWSEIDVSCEACHGPSSLHLQWAKMAESDKKKVENYGLIEKTSGLNNFEYVDQCARCHSRRSILNDYDPNNQSIYDHIIPNLPIESNYFVDGQIKEENYVYGSFVQSKMYMHDVKCNDCHNVHSGQLVLDGNKLCTQCHIAQNFDTPTHHFHKSVGEDGYALISEAGVKFDVGSGTQCINCHMHGANFMGVDYRRDHSFRIPRPDLSEKLGTPNACNQCHTDKSNLWSEKHIENWFGVSRPFQFGVAIRASQNNEPNVDRTLMKIIDDEMFPNSIRNTALNYLNNQNNKGIILQSLKSMESSTRITAVRVLALQSQEDIDQLLSLLNDDIKAVRIEVAMKLTSLNMEQIPEKYQTQFKDATEEYLETMIYNADFPVGKYNLGNYYYSLNNYEKAEKYFLAALKQDDELHMALINTGHLYASMGQPVKAEFYIKKYIDIYPNEGIANYNYGLILSENKKYEESLNYLIKASVLMPENGRIDYNIAMLYEYFQQYEKAEEYLKSSIEKDYQNITFHTNLLSFYMNHGRNIEAKKKARQMMNLFPNDPEVQQLRQML